MERDASDKCGSRNEAGFHDGRAAAEDMAEAKTMVVFMGIQGSGKSYYYDRHFAGSYARISLDELHTRSRESALFKEYLDKGMSFVVDNTNPTRADRARYLPAARAAGYRIVGCFFESKLKDCIERNDRRTGKARLTPSAIAATSNRLEMPSRAEGFDELYFVEYCGRFDPERGETPMIKKEWRES